MADSKLAHKMEKGRGLDERDTPVCAQCEQVLIAGHDVFSTTGKRRGEHVVIVRVTRDRRDFGWFHELT